jgi:hypothetical protein
MARAVKMIRLRELMEKALWDGAYEDFKKGHPSPEDYMAFCSIE